jgi:hypothetical protein
MTTVIVDCIALAESKFNRRLRTKQQETALAETAIDASYQVAIPANTLAIKRIWRTGTPVTLLDVAALDYVVMRQVGALAYAYAWEGSYWRFDGTGSVAGVLYRNIPPLASNATNWLLTAYPDAYLYAALAECAVYTRDAEALATWEARTEQKLADINITEARDSFTGALRVKAG